MKIIKGDLWDYQVPSSLEYTSGQTCICIPTNGILDLNGNLVMGAGLALEAKKRFITLPKKLGQFVAIYGNLPCFIPGVNIISFPTKHHWKNTANLELIKNSAYLIKMMVDILKLEAVYSPWPGCGLGSLMIDVVKPVLEEIWTDDRFVIVEN